MFHLNEYSGFLENSESFKNVQWWIKYMCLKIIKR